jgi:hypothetical protein
MAKSSGAGIGNLLWTLSVALYLIANGVLGLKKGSEGDFEVIFSKIGINNSLIVQIAAIISLVAGIALLLYIFNIKLSFLDTLIFIIAIIWAVYIVVEIFSWLKGDFSWLIIQRLAVHLMVFASLLIASRKF